MKICFVSSSYPGSDGVGNTFVEQLVNAIAALGHECFVIAPYNTVGIDKSYRTKEYEIKRINDKEIKVYRPRFWSRNINFLSLSSNLFFARLAFNKAIKEIGISFDLIYSHFFASALIAWDYAHRNNIPLFLATGESTIRSDFKKPCFSFSWEKFRIDTKGIICVSTKNYQESISLRYADASKCAIFPNGADLDTYRLIDKKECRQKLGYSLDDFITITVGEFSERKGQERIIKALDSLNDSKIKAVFIGKGQPLTQRDYILYQGKVAHQDLPIYLNAADVFVLPTRREGCCNAIVEALACSLPVVSSDCAFNKDILNQTNSILVAPDDVKALAECIRNLKADSELRTKLSEGALLSSRSLSIKDRALKIVTFIEKSLSIA